MTVLRTDRTSAQETPEVSHQDTTMPLNDGEISGLSNVGR